MFIEKLVIEGFKSYAQRVEINHFDKNFNAITGLNGTGKSNILDAICFALGLSRLIDVRVKSLKELIYMKGQTDIKKASVTIYFNNNDPDSSPQGFENVESIVISREIDFNGNSKFLLNNRLITAQKLQKILQSVSLNINNPHFLIMQGKVTKIIQMKPQELLSLLEECAGTAQFEISKKESQKTFDKKSVKIQEIDDLISTHISPHLEKLEQDKIVFKEWSEANEKLKLLDYRINTIQYQKLRESIKTAENRLLNLSENLVENYEKISKKIEENEKILKEYNNEISSYEESMKTNSEFLELSEVFSKKQIEQKNLQKEIQDFKNSSEKINHSIKNLEAEKASLNTQDIVSIKIDHENLILEKDRATENLKNLKSSKTSGVSSLISEKSKAEMDVSMAISRLELKVDQEKSNLNSINEKIKKNSEEKFFLNEEISTKKKDLFVLKSNIAQLDIGSESQELENYKKLKEQLSELDRQIDDLKDDLAHLDFKYSDPYPNFDRSKVSGKVISLVDLKDPKYAGAVEIIAGDRLYNVVVDSASTARMILEKGEIKNRVTIIPLDKIHPRRLKDHQKAGLSNISDAVEAIELIAYPSELEAAIRHVFAGNVIVQSRESANKVAFELGARCITMDGNIYEPSGVLTGGSRRNRSSVLLKICDLKNLESQKAHLLEAMQPLHEKVVLLEAASLRLIETRKRKQLIEQEIINLEKKLLSISADHSSEVSVLKLNIKALKDEIQAKFVQQQNLKDEISKLKIARENGVDGQIEAAEKLLIELESRIEKSSLNYDKISDKVARLHEIDVETKNLNEETLDIMKKISDNNLKLSKISIDISEIEQKINANQQVGESMKKNYEEIFEKKQILMKNIETLKMEQTTLEDEMKSSSSIKEVSEKTLKNSKIEIKKILKKFPKIEEEEEIAEFIPEQELIDEFKATEHRLNSLGRSVNKKSMIQYEALTQQFKDLTGKRKLLTDDKAKITSAIEYYDALKLTKLQEVYNFVNPHLNSIFSMMLPGASASLCFSGKTILDGIHFKVSLEGGHFKESLTELSGGQRSLLSLSLILALLKACPAPIYILDEIDSALDLSHTRRFGQLISEHFADSQFLIVSLKDDMFTNANVIYRTKLINGRSSVERTTNI